MSIAVDDLPSGLKDLIESNINSLEPISPHEAIDLFIESKRDDLTELTISEYENKLEYLKEYCLNNDLENLNDFNGRNIVEFSKWRKEESSDKVDELSKKTMRDELYLLTNFLRFLEDINGVEQGTAAKVNPPKLKPGEGVRDVELEIGTLREIAGHLSKYKYASREHVSIKTVEETGRRLGCIHSLDLCDVHLDGANPYLEFRHHDDRNTRLKNGKKSEQQVSISNEFAKIIKDYIENHRIEKEVDGRKPLLTTSHGRLAKGTIRTYFYQWTRPCMIGKACPHNRDPESCQAASSKDHASKCPDSEAPHAGRHGYLSEMRRQGVPKEVLSERCDVSEEILEEVYDERTTEEKRELRRQILEEALGQEGNE